MLTLCQDTEGAVRQAVCEQLPVLFKRLPAPQALKCLDELLELLNDEEAEVCVCVLLWRARGLSHVRDVEFSFLYR